MAGFNNGNASLSIPLSGEGDDARRKVIGYTETIRLFIFPIIITAFPLRVSKPMSSRAEYSKFLGQNIKEIGDFACRYKIGGRIEYARNYHYRQSAFANCADLTAINIPATVAILAKELEDCVCLPELLLKTVFPLLR